MDMYDALYNFLSGEDNDYDEPFADEVRWVDDDKLCVWISYSRIDEFVEEMQERFGDFIPEDGLNATMWEDNIVFNLCDIFNKSGLKRVYGDGDDDD